MTISTADFQYLSQLVRKRSAIVLEPEKAYLLDARLTPLAYAEGHASLAELVGVLRSGSDPGLQHRVVEAMTTNETSFFRDHYPFEALRTHVLPDLLARRAAQRDLRIWCGASSSGQEPYSIALTMREHFPELARWNVRLLGTDLSREMVRRCQAGRYSHVEVRRGLPPELLRKYFDPAGTEWQAKPALQAGCEFRELNLIESWASIPSMDIVFLRNVLIYFDLPTKRAILDKVRSVLQPWGYLFLGGAETVINLGDTFERVPVDRAGCYRLRGA